MLNFTHYGEYTMLTLDVEEPVLSCSKEANPDNFDTCCVETFGGLIVSPLRGSFQA